MNSLQENAVISILLGWEDFIQKRLEFFVAEIVRMRHSMDTSILLFCSYQFFK